jgi:PAS domain S-box-containing protein
MKIDSGLKKKLQALSKDENSFKELLGLLKESSAPDEKKKSKTVETPAAEIQMPSLNGFSFFLWKAERKDGSTYISFSESVKDLTGFTAEEIKKKAHKYLSIIHKDDYLEVNKKYSDFDGDRSENKLCLIYRISRKDGGIIWVKEQIFVERDENGNIERLHGAVFDIDEEKISERSLNEANSRLVKLNASKDKFISIISHDLRAPFTTILGFAEILMNDQTMQQKERSEYLTYIYESSYNQLQLINHLLDWSRLQLGAIKPEPRKLKAKNIIFSCISAFTEKAMRKNITIKTKASDSLSIYGDERLLMQAITNIISNSLKYSQPDSQIEISADKFKKGFVEFTISDHGIGIAPEYQSKLFKFDHKFSTLGTNGEKGSGLGLILTKEIIEKHGGDIWFYSQEQKGSEFHFTIPEAKDSILVLDDSKTDRLIFEKFVTKNFPKAELILAENGYDGISIIAQKLPALVITDHDMPLMNGIQFIESLRKKNGGANVKVVVVAAQIPPEAEEKYKALKINDILMKPIDMDKLKDILEILLES